MEVLTVLSKRSAGLALLSGFARKLSHVAHADQNRRRACVAAQCCQKPNGRYPRCLTCSAAGRASSAHESGTQYIRGCGRHSCKPLILLSINTRTGVLTFRQSQEVFLDMCYRRLQVYQACLTRLIATPVGRDLPPVRELLDVLRRSLHLSDHEPHGLQGVRCFDVAITAAGWAGLSSQVTALHRHRLPLPREESEDSSLTLASPFGATVPVTTYASLVIDVLGCLNAAIQMPRFRLPAAMRPLEPDPAAVEEACNVCKLVIVRGLFCAVCGIVLTLPHRSAAWRSGGACR